MPTVAEVLAKKRAERSQYAQMADFKDQIVTVVSFEEVPSNFAQKQIEISLITAAGEEVTNLRTSSQGVVETLGALAEENLLPAKLKVVSGNSSYPGGKPWFDFEEVAEA
jgi:hypothetical protein